MCTWCMTLLHYFWHCTMYYPGVRVKLAQDKLCFGRSITILTRHCDRSLFIHYFEHCTVCLKSFQRLVHSVYIKLLTNKSKKYHRIFKFTAYKLIGKLPCTYIERLLHVGWQLCKWVWSVFANMWWTNYSTSSHHRPIIYFSILVKFFSYSIQAIYDCSIRVITVLEYINTIEGCGHQGVFE